MTLQQLEYIIAIADHGQFVEAADACGVTQSTLSLMVKKLEAELDVTIFDRNSHPVVPTEIGRKIVDKARVILFNSRQLTEMTRSEKDLLSGQLRMAMISTVAPVLLPGMFRYFHGNCPDIRLEEAEMLTSTIKDKLKRAEIDMGIMASPVDDPALMEIPLYNESFLAYVSPSCKAYSKEAIESSELFDLPLWIMRGTVHLADRNKIIEGEDFQYEKFYEGGRAGTMIQIVNESGGMTVVPDSHVGLIMYSLHRHLRPIVNPIPKRVISLAVRKDFIHEKMLNAVIDAVRSIIPVENQENMIRHGKISI